MSEGSTRDSQTDPNSDMPDFAAFSPTLKKYQQTRDLYHGRLQGRLTSGGPGCLMAILCPLSADQLTAAGPPIWSMLAVWYELVPYSYTRLDERRRAYARTDVLRYCTAVPYSRGRTSAVGPTHVHTYTTAVLYSMAALHSQAGGEGADSINISLPIPPRRLLGKYQK
jgi:hypothetical protein